MASADLPAAHCVCMWQPCGKLGYLKPSDCPSCVQVPCSWNGIRCENEATLVSIGMRYMPLNGLSHSLLSISLLLPGGCLELHILMHAHSRGLSASRAVRGSRPTARGTSHQRRQPAGNMPVSCKVPHSQDAGGHRQLRGQLGRDQPIRAPPVFRLCQPAIGEPATLLAPICAGGLGRARWRVFWPSLSKHPPMQQAGGPLQLHGPHTSSRTALTAPACCRASFRQAGRCGRTCASSAWAKSRRALCPPCLRPGALRAPSPRSSRCASRTACCRLLLDCQTGCADHVLSAGTSTTTRASQVRWQLCWPQKVACTAAGSRCCCLQAACRTGVRTQQPCLYWSTLALTAAA